jgi:hypothetical protein
VRLSRDFSEPLSCSERDGELVVEVNPHTLPSELERHFASYIDKLRDPGQEALRGNFETRFDWQGEPKREATKY